MINPNAKLNPKIFTSDIEQKPTRDGFGDGMVLAGKEDVNVVGLCADLADSTRVGWFQKQFPDRYIEMGIAEQNMMGVATGLAMAGKIPFLSTYAVFCPGRNWDQMRVGVCYAKANVKMSGAHAGLSVGPDGGTHQGLEDIAITRCIPNLVVIAPADYLETRKATYAAAKYVGPVYLRFAREKTPIFTSEETPFEIGKAITLRDGKDAVIIGCGPLLYNALEAAEELTKEGIDVMVVNNHTIKPIDNNAIIEAAKLCGAVVTVEDHQIMGGMGSAVAEVLSQNCPVPMEFIGMKDKFGESGTPEELIEAFGMGKNAIKEAIKKVIGRKEKKQ
ncbi:MAG TPA: transketolase family protein [Candidatus Paceibacterota bacterium]|nr:transketolase family protein [Candidatus Paceibacterota bacterium]